MVGCSFRKRRKADQKCVIPATSMEVLRIKIWQDYLQRSTRFQRTERQTQVSLPFHKNMPHTITSACIFILICSVWTSARTTATEWKHNSSSSSSSSSSSNIKSTETIAGRPALRWENVREDLGKMKFQNWSKMATDRAAWKTDAERTKTHRVVQTNRSTARRSQEDQRNA
jgi:hypothetical protein